ncbi:MAG: hypothetical protein IJD10_05110 [Clostridia bacterium]|nr:hypothetical protein [Clostridia bacterium]
MKERKVRDREGGVFVRRPAENDMTRLYIVIAAAVVVVVVVVIVAVKKK